MAAQYSLDSIENSMDIYRAKNIQIEDEKAIQWATELKNEILTGKAEDHTRSVVILAKLLKLSNPNDGFFQVFSESLLDKIFSQITSQSSLEAINFAIKILDSIVNGLIFVEVPASQYAIPILNSTNTNLKILEIIANKILDENIDFMVHALSFINGYLTLDHVQFNSINHLAEFILHLQKAEILVILGNMIFEERFGKFLMEPMQKVQGSYQNNVTLLTNLKIDLNSKYQKEVLNIVLNQVTEVETEKEREFILENFTVFHLIDLYFFLDNTNITFKKAYHQQILFNSNKSQKFPLSLASLKVSNYLTEIFSSENSSDRSQNGKMILQNYFFLRDSLQYSFIAKFLEIWVESKAELEDFDNLMKLIQILLDVIADSLRNSSDVSPVDKVILTCKETTYQKLRQIQLNTFKAHVDDITSSETEKFDRLLNDQTYEFVKNQRFMNLAQGAWVYAQLPTSKKDPVFYFIILSANFKQVLFKEFKVKTEGKPDIDKTGTSIDISSITNFEIEEIIQVDKNAPPASNPRLINLTSKTAINKISLMNRKNRVQFTFYAKKDESLVWLDGLNLLLGNKGNLSVELKDQLAQLYNIRKTVQLLNFDEGVEKELMKVVDNDKNLNDLQFLEKLSTNFYYT